jgi:mono/diheme cytochrome c family protein
MTPTSLRRGRTAFIFAATVIAGASGAAAAEETVSWKLDVQPILQAHCVECHKPGGQGLEATGLNLTSYKGLMTGTKHGPIVIPGDTLSSNLLVLIEGRAHPQFRMPHGQRPLLKQQIEIIRLWVKQGALDN